MRIDPDYEFSISISEEEYVCKEDVNCVLASVNPKKVSPDKIKEIKKTRKKYGHKANDTIIYHMAPTKPKSMLGCLNTGKIYCNLFTDRFTKSEKTKANFSGAYTIGVDIDETSYPDPRSFIEKLSLKPTLWYTSYSNMQTDENGNNKGTRFRMIYVFSEDLMKGLYIKDESRADPYIFKYMAHHLNSIIERDTGEIIHDKCNESCAQYFNGTYSHAEGIVFDCGCTDIIYDKTDLWTNEEDFQDGLISFLKNYCEYKTINDDTTEGIQRVLEEYTGEIYKLIKGEARFAPAYAVAVSETSTDDDKKKRKCSKILVSTLHKYGYKDRDKVQQLVGFRYKRIYRKEKDLWMCKPVFSEERNEWVDVYYQITDEDYFRLHYIAGKITDGHHRRNILYARTCIRRLLKPDTTADELLYNAYLDVCEYFDTTDIDIDSLVMKAESAMCQSTDRIRSIYRKIIEKETPNHATVLIRPGIARNKRENDMFAKRIRWELIDKEYDKNLSIEENVKLIKENLRFNVSKRTLYNIIESTGSRQKRNLSSDDEIKRYIDTKKSIRDNISLLKSKGISVGKDRIRRLLSEKK